MTFDLVKATFLGVVEGLTEFIPVSSTGHLLLVQRFFGFDDEDFGKTFAVLIQFGAILALLSIYFARLWALAIGMFTDPAARRFVIGVLIAFLPAGVIGALAYHFIKDVLFNVWIVCFTLIVGGAILLWIDQLDLQAALSRGDQVHAADVSQSSASAQCLSMIPGVSRSGATIVAAMLLGADKRARPRSSRSGWRCRPWRAPSPMTSTRAARELSSSNTSIIAVGFAVSFVCGWIVVKTFLDYVSRHGFDLFAWWRVIVGTLGLIALALGY